MGFFPSFLDGYGGFVGSSVVSVNNEHIWKGVGKIGNAPMFV